MKTSAKHFARSMLLVSCAVLLTVPHIYFATSAFAQSGGNYTINPSVTSGGGSASSNGNIRIEGSIGQNTLGTSSAAQFSINSGFWPNAVPCPFAVGPRAQFFTTAGGAGSINVVAPGFCGWTATVEQDWIVITSTESGSGNEVITFEVRENFTGIPRQGAINVSGLRQVVVQDAGLGEDCQYEISPAFQSFSSSGGTGTISVVAEERCAWQAIVSDGWITITSLSVGIGNRTVVYTVAANVGSSARNGSMIIAGREFSVKQKGN
jgi:hypothetical protein